MIGERLAELRKDQGWEQKDLAEILKVSYHTISSYERNRSEPNHEMLVKIAKLFNISADYLLGLVRERVSYNRSQSMLLLPESLKQEQVEQIKQFVAFVEKEYKSEDDKNK